MVLNCLLSCSTKQWAIYQLDGNMWSEVCVMGMLAITHPVTGLRRSPLACSQTNIPEQWSCLLLLSAAGLITTAFGILVKPLHLRSRCTRFVANTENFNNWSWQWSTGRIYSSTVTPKHMSHKQHSENGTRWYWDLPHSPYLPAHSTFLSLLPSCKKSASITDRKWKILSSAHQIQKLRFF